MGFVKEHVPSRLSTPVQQMLQISHDSWAPAPCSDGASTASRIPCLRQVAVLWMLVGSIESFATTSEQTILSLVGQH